MTADTEFSDADRLVAAIIGVEQQLPGGYHLALVHRLDRVIAAVGELYTAHQLPRRAELLAELTLWRCLIEDGVKFDERCTHHLQVAMWSVREREAGSSKRRD